MIELEGPAATVLVAARRETRIPLESRDQRIVAIRVDSGASALTVAREVSPALILLDLSLPDANGLDVCRQLRADPLIERSVPVLLLAGTKPTAEQRVAALQVGASSIVMLPVDADELELTVRLLAEAKRHFDNAAAAERFEASAGIHTSSDFVRQAQRMGTLMYRVHAGLACVVFEVSGGVVGAHVAAGVARTARASDIVGVLGLGRIGVMAPATSPSGAVALAQRIGSEARRVLLERSAELKLDAAARLLVGYDAVSNARYSPVDPLGLIRNATLAVRNGVVEPGTIWLRAADTVVRDSIPEIDRPNSQFTRSAS